MRSLCRPPWPTSERLFWFSRSSTFLFPAVWQGATAFWSGIHKRSIAISGTEKSKISPNFLCIDPYLFHCLSWKRKIIWLACIPQLSFILCGKWYEACGLRYIGRICSASFMPLTISNILFIFNLLNSMCYSWWCAMAAFYYCMIRLRNDHISLRKQAKTPSIWGRLLTGISRYLPSKRCDKVAKWQCFKTKF